MRTKATIGAIVVVIALACIAILVVLVAWLGAWVGLAAGVAIAAAVIGTYRLFIRPWHSRWGATEAEVAREMPGDDLLTPDAPGTTRAITIDAPPENVWPWLVQIGYGRAGWYSYDWIDNDGKRSAERVLPELQNLRVGDQILMVPDLGPTVKALRPNEFIVSGGEADSWCLALYPIEGTTRLVSRWRVAWPKTVATAFWILISDPGAFLFERKMLKGIKARAEAAVAPRSVATS